MKKHSDSFDFTALGKAIKKARLERNWTREQVAEMLDLVPRYIQSLENEGQHPSLKVFYELVTLYDISVDQFFFPGKERSKSSRRRQLDSFLDTLDESDLIVVEGTVKGICKAKEAEAVKPLFSFAYF